MKGNLNKNMFISQHCLPLVSWFCGLVDFEVLCLFQRHNTGPGWKRRSHGSLPSVTLVK